MIRGLVDRIHNHKHVVYADTQKHEWKNVMHSSHKLPNSETKTATCSDWNTDAEQSNRSQETAAVYRTTVPKHEITIALHHAQSHQKEDGIIQEISFENIYEASYREHLELY